MHSNDTKRVREASSMESNKNYRKLYEELQRKYDESIEALKKAENQYFEAQLENKALRNQVELQQASFELFAMEMASPKNKKTNQKDLTLFSTRDGSEPKHLENISLDSKMEIKSISPFEVSRRLMGTSIDGLILPKNDVTSGNFTYDLYIFGDMYNELYEKERSTLAYLYQFKSLQQKILLLDDALQNPWNYNNILVLLLWLKDSLSPDLFLKIILTPRKQAQKIYIRYLERIKQWKDVETLNRIFENIQDYGISLYQKVSSYSYPGTVTERELSAIDDTIEKTSRYPLLQFETNEFISLKNLLIREVDFNEYLKGRYSPQPENAMQNIPPPSTVKVPLRDFIHNLLVFHPKSSAIQANKTFFGMSNKHFTYLQVLASCQRGEWHTLPNLLPVSGIISKKPNSPLNLYTYLTLCHQFHVPDEVIEHFMSYVYPEQLRLAVAKYLRLYDLSIALCQKLRWKEELLLLKDMIKNSEENEDRKTKLDRKIEDVLIDPRLKWSHNLKMEDYNLKVLFT